MDFRNMVRAGTAILTMATNAKKVISPVVTISCAALVFITYKGAVQNLFPSEKNYHILQNSFQQGKDTDCQGIRVYTDGSKLASGNTGRVFASSSQASPNKLNYLLLKKG